MWFIRCEYIKCYFFCWRINTKPTIVVRKSVWEWNQKFESEKKDAVKLKKNRNNWKEKRIKRKSNKSNQKENCGTKSAKKREMCQWCGMLRWMLFRWIYVAVASLLFLLFFRFRTTDVVLSCNY